MNIIGAGLAGLLAGNMLKHHNPTLIEAQAALPNNHSAVLRFRTSQIGDVTRIPFKRVTMIKCTQQYQNPVADSLAYSFKNSGTYRSDRSINAGTVTEDRFIAPPDLIPKLASGLDIQYATTFKFGKNKEPVISTIPMPMLMRALAYPEMANFTHSPGTNLRARIKDCDAYVSILVPDPRLPFSRISITGDEVIAECPQQAIDLRGTMMGVAGLLGIPYDQLYDLSRHEQKYAKINPIPDEIRRDFIYWATTEHNIYSLGRFATWRPGLLMDSLINDIRLIDNWVTSRDHYARFRHK